MPRTLLVDTNRAAYPIHQALLTAGHDVWVVGARPTDPLAQLTSNYIQLDYSNAECLAKVIDTEGFDYLVPGCTDASYRVCSEINNGRFSGIEPPEINNTINIKSEFRNAAAQVNMPTPRILKDEEAAEVKSVIVKPVDSFSGKGITVLHHPTKRELESAFDLARKASKTECALIEEFVEGQLYSHSSFIRNGIVVADFVVQEDSYAHPFAVDTSRVVETFSQTMLHSIRDDVRRFAALLNLLDGLIHIQFIVKNDQYWIIEMNRRCPGDIYSLLIEFSTAYPYAESYVAPFIGKEIHRPDPDTVRQRIIRHTASSKKGEPLWGFSFTQPVDIRLFVPLATSGKELGIGPNGRAGIYFFKASSKNEEEMLYKKLLTGELYTFR